MSDENSPVHHALYDVPGIILELVRLLTGSHQIDKILRIWRQVGAFSARGNKGSARDGVSDREHGRRMVKFCISDVLLTGKGESVSDRGKNAGGFNIFCIK